MEDVKAFKLTDDNFYHEVAYEKGRILKESLKIVENLAKLDLADIVDDITNDDFDELQKLIIRARKLKQNRYFLL